MGEESRVADYFVVAGLPDDPQPMDDYTDGTHLKQNYNLAPITDITIIFPSLGEVCPDGWQVLEHTPTGLWANLNYGSLNGAEVFLCYKRGRHKPPLVDIGVLFENKDRILSDSEIVLKTPYDRIANVNNASTNTFITYRRAKKDMPANELVVTNICVIITSKGEKPPHAFCVIKKNLNRGVFGQNVFLCYKKSMNRANLISYKPGILCRYPSWDRPDWKLHSNVPLFCLPMGATLEVWPPEASQPPPVFSTFVLTVSDAAEKVYGSAVTFYERYPLEKLTEEQLSVLETSLEGEGASRSNLSVASSEKSLGSKETSPSDNLSEENFSSLRRSLISGSHTFNVNKCICILSHWPFFDTFEKFLVFLFKLSTTGPHSVPIERYISYFLEHVPFPSPQRPRILVQLSAKEKVILSQPEDNPLPRSGAGFRELLLNLGSEDSLLVLLLVLTEHKILVHSLRPNVLTSVVEALSMIMFPFKWQCPYIPLCPLGLAEVLHAPVPYLIGVDSRFFDMYDPPSDVACIDLDTNNITILEEKRNLSYKLLPKKAAKILKSTLDNLCKKCNASDDALQSSRFDDDEYDCDMSRFQLKDKEQKIELEIQEAFLRFMATILRGYRSYLLPIVKAPTARTTDPNSLFDLQGFLKSRDRAHHKFFMMLMKTQMFIRFIEERSFVSDMDVGLAFFDECTEKVDSEDFYGRLLESEESHKSERTVFIPPPEPSGLSPVSTYEYQGFNLDSSLFKSRDTKNVLHVPSQGNAPGSPMARRTKHEVKSAQKLARRKHSQSAQSWATCLLNTCYSLWFIHLPSFVINDSSKSSSCLRIAYELLVKIQKLKLHPTDEVCYRVMMQLFGIYSQPVLAVNLLSQMKMCGIQPNALTYGYYNRAVLEATWPSDQSHPSQLWSKLRNVIVGAALFRRGGHRARNKLPEAESCTSIASLEKGDLLSELEKLMRRRTELGSVMKPNQQNIQELIPYQTLDNSAGILMTANKRSPTLSKNSKIYSDFSPRLQQSNSSIPADVNTARLRRGSMSPTIAENDTLKMLIRCDSFANDTSILEKHTRTNKITEKQNCGISKTLSVPRESSESLDITDDFSLEESWSSRRNSDKRESLKGENKTDMPTRTLISKLNCLGSENWNRNQRTASQDSVESAPLSDDKEKQENSIRPPWKSSEGLLTSDDLNKMQTKGRNQRSSSESRGGCNKQGKNSQNFSEDNLKTTPCSSLLNSSEDILELSSTPSQADIFSCDEDKKTEKCLEQTNTMNGGFDLAKRNELSPSLKSSPIRTPVTENDPLGALQAADSLNGNEDAIIKIVETKNALNTSDVVDRESSRMKYDLLIGGMFSHSPLRNKKDNDPSKKIDEEKLGQGDSSSSNRFPKSATFHNGREKEPKARTVPRGSTPPTQEAIFTSKPMHRSTTLPDTAVASSVSSSPSVAASLSNFSSNFKFSFSRYSPSRFSLKKSDLRIAKTQILENAISGSKKSNELLLSGFNTVKSAASTVAKKIEEVISTNSTPVKSFNISHDYDEEDDTCEKNSSLDSRYETQQDAKSWSTNFKEFFVDGSRKSSSANLQPYYLEEHIVHEDSLADNLYGKNSFQKSAEGPTSFMVVMTTCCKCNNCCSILHDEEIIAGWTPEDSNLITKCHFCSKSTLPFLSVSIYDYRGRDKNAKTGIQKSNISQNIKTRNLTSSDSSVNTEIENSKNENKETSDKPIVLSGEQGSVGDNKKEEVNRDEAEELVKENVEVGSGDAIQTYSDDKNKTNENNFEPYVLEPIIVPYLNPLVLRKELENILHHEGDPSLTKSSFVDQHPIVYWNLVWFFERINVTSHLPDLALGSSAAKKNELIHPSWTWDCNLGSVSVKCLWDNPRLYEEIGQPMYLLWQQEDYQSSLVNALVTDKLNMPKKMMQNIVANIRQDKLYDSMRLLLNERAKQRRTHSLYRDLLFLAITACDRTNIVLDTFDREYTLSYYKLREEDIFQLRECDKPPKLLPFPFQVMELQVACSSRSNMPWIRSSDWQFGAAQQLKREIQILMQGIGRGSFFAK